ncbi:MAG: type II secretion system F family protein [Lachnospiraceae bacterium]
MNKKGNPIVREHLKKLYPGKDEEKLVKSFYGRKRKMAGVTILTGIVIGILLFISGLADRKISETGEIVREGYDGSAIQIPATVHSEQYGKMDVDIDVDRRIYDEEEAEKLFDRAESWLGQVMPGENEGLTCVREDLVFPSFYEEADIAIAYTSSNYALINGSGEVQNAELEKEEKVRIRAEFSYENMTREKDYEITVYPPLLTQIELFQKELKEIISEENNRQRESEVFQLPDRIGGEAVTYEEKRDNRVFYILLLTLVCAVCLYRGMDRDLERLYEKRKQKLLLSYPAFVSKLALFVGAGMSVTGAIRRIYTETDGQGEEPLYEELGILVHELDNGKLEADALADLGKRNGLPQYRKFCSLLSVNMKKGSMNLRELLEQEAEEAFTEHQFQIRKLGEEAGTKLLLPMVMMLAVVLVIIMVPAFMTYQI